MLSPMQGLLGLKTFHSGLLFNSHVSTQVTPQRYCPSFIYVAVIKYTDIKQQSERGLFQASIQVTVHHHWGKYGQELPTASHVMYTAKSRDECIHAGLCACLCLVQFHYSYTLVLLPMEL